MVRHSTNKILKGQKKKKLVSLKLIKGGNENKETSKKQKKPKYSLKGNREDGQVKT